MPFTDREILETVRRIELETLDIRATTLGIDLLDCADPDLESACEEVYTKIVHHGRSLVAVANSSVGGLSGAFIPVSEDQGMIDAVAAGALTLAKLEAMTTVCSVGLDMIAVPGDTSAATVTGLIADEMAIGMVNSNSTAVRVLPIPDRGPGEMHDWGGRLGAATILDPGPLSCEVLWLRGVTDPGADAE